MALRGSILISALLLIQLRFSSGAQCYLCNSSEDENCATFKGNQSMADCAGNCAVWVEGMNTVRGCESLKPENVTNFKSCSSNGCNNLMFPEDRIKCVSCSADDSFCVVPNANSLYPCKNYMEDDKCYTHAIDENSAIRGCLSDQDENVDFCNLVGKACIKCSEEFCNVQRAYVLCSACSSETDPNCGYTQIDFDEPNLCKAILGRENLCFSFGNESNYIRGCHKDFPDLEEKCAENSKECQTCNEDLCNSMKIIEETCVVCDSAIDDNCKNVLEIQTPTLCGDGSINESGCYLSNKDGVTKRGCVASLSDSNLEDCRDGTDCKICHGNMCNKKETFQKCFTCNSEADPNCATLRGELTEKVCDDYLDTCKVYVKPNRTTHRGCFKDDNVECSPQSVNCKSCDENNCNGEIFPSNRLSCYQCKGENSSTECYKSLEDNLDLSYPCKTFNFRDSCYLYITNRSVIHRGCMSDATYPEMCQSDPERCRTCTTSGCNFESVMKAPELTCIACDSTNNHPECNWGWSESMAKKCEKEIFFFEKETCYLITVSNQTIRGCTLDGNVCRVSPRCTLCAENNVCNRANTAQQFCYQCSSESDKNCGLQPFHTKNITCPGIIQYDHRGCYTWISEGNTVKRGCYSDFSADDRRSCTIDGENCERCVDGNCNNQPKGSAGKMSVNFVFLLFTIVIILLY